MLIEAVGVVKAYGGPEPEFKLGPVSMAISLGDIVVLTGQNGSGKSTLLAILARSIVPDQGQVRWQDGLRPPDVITMEQDYYTLSLPWFSCRSNLELLWYSSAGCKCAATGPDLAEALVPPILRGKIDRPAYTLSGGEIQAMVLARVLMSGRRVLLLDEPFSNLDGESTEFFARIIAERCASREHACVVVAHDPPEIPCRTSQLRLADGGLSLEQGA